MTQQIEIISPLIIKGGEPTEAAVEAHRELLEFSAQATGYDAVLDAADRLKRWADYVEAERKRIKAPILTAGKDIDAAAKALDVTAEIDRLKKLRFEMEAAARAEAEAKIAAAREAARLAAEEAAREAEFWGTAPEAVVVPSVPAVALPPATVTTRKKYSVRIIDPAKIPRGYMIPAIDLILAALREGKEVAGCKLDVEDQIVEKPRGAR